jgi:hypothetical protein
MRTTEIMNNRSSEDPRWARLRPPATAGSPLTRRRFLAGTGIILTGPALIASCGSTRADRGEAQPANTTRVHFRLIDAQTGKPTPAMACISDAGSGEIRLPPDGRLCAKPSTVRQFYSGVQFNPDPNWHLTSNTASSAASGSWPVSCAHGTPHSTCSVLTTQSRSSNRLK